MNGISSKTKVEIKDINQAYKASVLCVIDDPIERASIGGSRPFGGRGWGGGGLAQIKTKSVFFII